MIREISWIYGEWHMWVNHGVDLQAAGEVVEDPNALLFYPDPKDQSGRSGRLIGYSPSLYTVIVLILVPKINGGWWGVNGWRANSTDRRVYREGASG